MKSHLLRCDSDVASLLSFLSLYCSISSSIKIKCTSDTEAFKADQYSSFLSHHYRLFVFLGPHNMAPVFLSTEDTHKGTFYAFTLPCPVQCFVEVPAEVFTLSVTTGRSHVQLFGNSGFEFSS